jgi:hypothetical protein
MESFFNPISPVSVTGDPASPNDDFENVSAESQGA